MPAIKTGTSCNTASNVWFGSTTAADRSSSDRIKKVRNRALYRNTMQIAALGGLKHTGGGGGGGGSGSGGGRGVVFEPATRLNGKCVSLPGETGPSGCASFFIRSAPSYEDLLRVTEGMYEGRGRTPVLPPAPTNISTVRRVTPSNPLSTSDRYNYLGATTDLLVLSAVNSSAAVFDAAKKRPVDAAQCMQYPPNPNVSITYGGGGCQATSNL